MKLDIITVKETEQIRAYMDKHVKIKQSIFDLKQQLTEITESVKEKMQNLLDARDEENAFFEKLNEKYEVNIQPGDILALLDSIEHK